MKKRKVEDKKENRKVLVKNQCVNVERKKEVVFVNNNVHEMTEEDIKELLMQVAIENKKLKEIYYSLNTPIIETKQRSFVDLVKKFFHEIKYTNRNRVGVKYRNKRNSGLNVAK